MSGQNFKLFRRNDVVLFLLDRLEGEDTFSKIVENENDFILIPGLARNTTYEFKVTSVERQKFMVSKTRKIETKVCFWLIPF